MSGDRVGRYVRMVAVEGKGGALAAGLLRVAEGMRDAPGCELYVVNRTPDEDDAVWITVLGLLAGPPEFIELSPVGGPGLS
ncbi:MAG: antibiotic biosynthesis monooxygenase [Pseudonocardia sp. SCN 72-86]|nr:MAG: antibiotic biosynthesis monooxygenase [Pseudonocardia sp. SCN 72-86]